MMLGQKSRHFKTHPSLTLEGLVPADHFYRKLESKLDLEFVRELVAPCYAEPGLRGDLRNLPLNQRVKPLDDSHDASHPRPDDSEAVVLIARAVMQGYPPLESAVRSLDGAAFD